MAGGSYGRLTRPHAVSVSVGEKSKSRTPGHRAFLSEAKKGSDGTPSPNAKGDKAPPVENNRKASYNKKYEKKCVSLKILLKICCSKYQKSYTRHTQGKQHVCVYLHSIGLQPVHVLNHHPRVLLGLEPACPRSLGGARYQRSGGGFPLLEIRETGKRQRTCLRELLIRSKPEVLVRRPGSLYSYTLPCKRKRKKKNRFDSL